MNTPIIHCGPEIELHCTCDDLDKRTCDYCEAYYCDCDSDLHQHEAEVT